MTTSANAMEPKHTYKIHYDYVLVAGLTGYSTWLTDIERSLRKPPRGILRNFIHERLLCRVPVQLTSGKRSLRMAISRNTKGNNGRFLTNAKDFSNSNIGVSIGWCSQGSSIRTKRGCSHRCLLTISECLRGWAVESICDLLLRQ